MIYTFSHVNGMPQTEPVDLSPVTLVTNRLSGACAALKPTCRRAALGILCFVGRFCCWQVANTWSNHVPSSLGAWLLFYQSTWCCWQELYHYQSRFRSGTYSKLADILQHLTKQLPAMPASTDELSDLDTDGLLQHALDVVRGNFSSEHLPRSIHDFLLPISVATCQGLFATTTMLAAAMPALTNGASVELWSQKPSPLALLAIHVAKP